MEARWGRRGGFLLGSLLLAASAGGQILGRHWEKDEDRKQPKEPDAIPHHAVPQEHAVKRKPHGVLLGNGPIASDTAQQEISDWVEDRWPKGIQAARLNYRDQAHQINDKECDSLEVDNDHAPGKRGHEKEDRSEEEYLGRNEHCIVIGQHGNIDGAHTGVISPRRKTAERLTQR